MATVAYHTLHSTQTVVLTEPEEYNGKTYPAGEYQVPVDGRYWTGFDRQDPLEGPAREQAWTGTAHALIANLGVGTVTADDPPDGLRRGGSLRSHRSHSPGRRARPCVGHPRRRGEGTGDAGHPAADPRLTLAHRRPRRRKGRARPNGRALQIRVGRDYEGSISGQKRRSSRSICSSPTRSGPKWYG